VNKARMNSTWAVVVGLVALACATASSARADVIPVTTWADNIAGGNGTNAPLFNSPGSNARISGSYSLQSLVAVGDSISLTGSFVLTGSPPTNQPVGVFRWGLYNVNGQPGNNGWQGYLAESDSSNAVAGSDLWRKTNLTSNYTTPGGTDFRLANVEQVAGGLAAGVSYAFELKASRLAGDQLQVDWSLSNGFSSSVVDPTPSTFSFDRVGLFVGQQLNSSAQFTDVNVTVTQVPEPGTLVLAGLGAAGLALAYRRRRG